VKRVLLTGAGGFIGRHSIDELLARGYEVHSVGRHPFQFEVAARVTHHIVDLLIDHEMESLVDRVKPSHLLHLAWYAVPGKFWTAVENLDWVGSSLRLLRAFASAGGRRALLAGSCAEYDWEYEVLNEATTPLRPRTLYGEAKCALRTLAGSAAPSLALSLAWGRIFWLYGPHEASGRLVSDVARAMLRGEPAKCSHGRQQRDFLHVADVASAMVAVLDSDVVGAVNIASGKSCAVRDIVEEMAEIIGRTDLPQFDQASFSPNEPARLVADIVLLKDRVGFRPRFELGAGLANTIDWWRQEISGNAHE
jgi:nucleoside-diphosphate-sugar epimerase